MNPGIIAARAAPRCGAKGKRSGKPCQAPKLRGRPRCRLHGGRSGRPAIHGRYSKEAKVMRAEVRELLREILAIHAPARKG